MDHRQLLRSLNAGRIAVGAALVLTPGTSGSRWIGPEAYNPATKVAIRAMGARDLALGLGTMHALAEGAPVRSWALAGALSDIVDATAGLLAVRKLGFRRALPFVAIAAAAAASSYVAADRLT